MKKLLIPILLLTSSWLTAQALYFPPLSGDTWETVSPAELGWCADRVEDLLQFVAENNSKSFLILKDGRIVVERYYGDHDAGAMWYWASAGKSLMAVLVGLAQQDGQLDIEAPASDYLGLGWTDCAPEDEARIRIRHQISMSTGLDDSLEPTGATSNCFEPECFQCLADTSTRWAYHNSPYRIVQDILESAVGQNKTLYTRQRLGNRIGMAGFWFNYVYYSTARDMARFGLFTLARGSWAGDTVLTDQAYFDAMTNTSQPMNPAYGYLWWLNGKDAYLLPGPQFSFSGSLFPSAPDDLIAALGLNEQRIYVVPSAGLVVVRQGESAGGASPAASSFDNQLWQRIMALPCAVSSTDNLGEQGGGLRVAPNPARLELEVTAPEPLREISLFGLDGQRWRRWLVSGTQVSLSLQGLPAGLYFLQAVSAQGRWVERVVVME